MKALIDKNNLVCQVSEKEFEVASPFYWVKCTRDIVAMEYKYNPENKTFNKIESANVVSPSPDVVTMRQARLALFQKNLLISVESAIESLPEEIRQVAKIEWEYSTTVNKNSSLVKTLSVAFSLNQQEVDELFSLAASL